MRKIDLTGKKFGKLTVIKFSHIGSDKKRYWKCICECGNYIAVSTDGLRGGRTKSCGGNYFYKKDGYMVGVNHNGAEFIFDVEDYELIKQHTWSVKENGYFRANINSKNVKIHRFIIKPRKNEPIDHINGNRADNRKSNLRICTNQQNHFNQRKTRGKSKYKGVGWMEKSAKWRASIGKDNKVITLGYFKNEIDAAKAYNKKAKELFGEFAKLNDI